MVLNVTLMQIIYIFSVKKLLKLCICLCILSQALKAHVSISWNFTNYLYSHFCPDACWLVTDKSVSHLYLCPTVLVYAEENLKGSLRSGCCFLLFPRCKFLPSTESKHFCQPDKCARGKNKKTKQKTSIVHSNTTHITKTSPQRSQSGENKTCSMTTSLFFSPPLTQVKLATGINMCLSAYTMGVTF